MATQQTTEAQGYWDVPDGWEWRSIDNVAEIPPDNSKATEENLVSHEGTIPFIMSGDLKNTKDIKISRWTTEQALARLNIKPLEKDRILLARARAETVGRIGIFKGKAVHNRGVHAIVPRQDIENPIELDYLFYCFLAGAINSRIVEEVIVRGKSSIQKKHTKQVMIPVPSPAEQLWIVERIETLLDDVERTRALLQNTYQDIELFTRSPADQYTAVAANQDIQDQIVRMREQATRSEQLLNAVEQEILSEALRGNLFRERK